MITRILDTFVQNIFKDSMIYATEVIVRKIQKFTVEIKDKK